MQYMGNRLVVKRCLAAACGRLHCQYIAWRKAVIIPLKNGGMAAKKVRVISTRIMHAAGRVGYSYGKSVNYYGLLVIYVVFI